MLSHTANAFSFDTSDLSIWNFLSWLTLCGINLSISIHQCDKTWKERRRHVIIRESHVITSFRTMARFACFCSFSVTLYSWQCVVALINMFFWKKTVSFTKTYLGTNLHDSFRVHKSNVIEDIYRQSPGRHKCSYRFPCPEIHFRNIVRVVVETEVIHGRQHCSIGIACTKHSLSWYVWI